MTGDTRSGSFTNICAHIKGLGIVDFAQRAHAARGQFHHFGARGRVEVFQRGFVRQWGHHHMPAGVWKFVQDDKGALAAHNDQIIVVVAFCERVAKDTTRFFGGMRNILHAPGGPQSFHGLSLSLKTRFDDDGKR
jgi:hypothetical protein